MPGILERMHHLWIKLAIALMVPLAVAGPAFPQRFTPAQQEQRHWDENRLREEQRRREESQRQSGYNSYQPPFVPPLFPASQAPQPGGKPTNTPASEPASVPAVLPAPSPTTEPAPRELATKPIVAASLLFLAAGTACWRLVRRRS